MKINNYFICYKILNYICDFYNVNYKDLEVKFTDDLISCYKDDYIFISSKNTISQNSFNIICNYLINFKNISGIDIEKTNLDNLIRLVFLSVQDYYGFPSTAREEFKKDFDIKFLKNKISQFGLPYILLKNIFFNFYSKEIPDHEIYSGFSGIFDSSGTLDVFDNKLKNIIFFNLDINNEEVSNAYLFNNIINLYYSDLKDNFIKDISSDKVISDIFYGIIKTYYSSDLQSYRFIEVFLSLNNIGNENLMIDQKSNFKTAQSSGSWWFPGLIEKMLDGTRGPDWSTYDILTPYISSLNDKINLKKKELNLKELPLETLLRVSSEDYKTDHNRIIQSLLGEARDAI